MKVFVSNRLETLADVLKEQLFQTGGHPFAKRWVLVPSERIQQALLLRWAQDNELKIAAGIKIITWSSALRQIFPNIPSNIELSLKIEKALAGINEVQGYLLDGGPQRKASFCDRMSSLFLQYLSQPDFVLEGWQQKLWQKVLGDELLVQQPLEGEVYLFHCWQVAPYQLEALKKMNATCFLFSPCALYWGDLQTFREQRFLLNKAHENEREELLNYFKNDHPLLANWGKRGRDLLELFEEEEGIEAFEPSQSDSLLTAVQEEMLTLSLADKKPDQSIQIHAAPSKMREVEVVWEIIQRLPYQPSEILVVTPDIQAYASAIELVFRQRGGPFDYAIYGLEAKAKSPLIQGFKDLLDLPRYRFSRDSVEKLLSCPPFLNRFRFTGTEVQKLQEWFMRAAIRYDLSGWDAGLARLVEALVLTAEELVVEFSEADLLSRWIGVMNLFDTELQLLNQEITLTEWAKGLKKLVETFFFVDDNDDYLVRELDRLHHFKVEGPFPFSSLERVLTSIFHQNIGTVQGSHLQAVKFAALEKGALMPAKAVILMGMEEGNFPRQELPSSLQQIALPSRIDDDRYLFLEAVCHARRQLVITYTRLNAEDGKSQKLCSLADELARHCLLSIIDHPFTPFDPSYFQKDGFRSYSSSHFEAVQRKGQPRGHLALPEQLLSLIDVRMLRKLARHPVQYFFEESLGIDFEWEEDETEFVLSPLEMARLRKRSLKMPLDQLMRKLEKEGKLPVGSFGRMARMKIETEVSAYHEALKELQVQPDEIYSIELKVACTAPVQVDAQNWIYPALRVPLAGREIVIQGRIDELSPKGLLYHGDETLPELLKAWPLYLIVKNLPLPHAASLLLTKKGKAAEIDGSMEALQRYVLYAEKALSSPSPLFPKWARNMFNEGKIGADDDKIVQWAEARQLLPPKELWVQSWSSYLQEAVRELV